MQIIGVSEKTIAVRQASWRCMQGSSRHTQHPEYGLKKRGWRRRRDHDSPSTLLRVGPSITSSGRALPSAWTDVNTGYLSWTI